MALEESLRAAQHAINMLATLSNVRSITTRGARDGRRENAGVIHDEPKPMESTTSKEHPNASQGGVKRTPKEKEAREERQVEKAKKTLEKSKVKKPTKSMRIHADKIEENREESKAEKPTKSMRKHADRVEESIAERKTKKTTEPMRRHAGRVEESIAERKAEKTTEPMRRHAGRVEERSVPRSKSELFAEADSWYDHCIDNGISEQDREEGLRLMHRAWVKEKEESERVGKMSSRHMAMPRRPE